MVGRRELEKKVTHIFASLRSRLTDFEMLSRDEDLFDICENIREGLNELEGKIKREVGNENQKEM